MGRSRSRARRGLPWKYIGLGLLAAAVITVVGLAIFMRPDPPASAVSYTPPPPAPELPVVAVIGDSYTAGTSFGGMNAKNWTKVARADLYAEGKQMNLVVRGLGAAGYATPGTAKLMFPQVVPQIMGPKTDLVVIVGSRNDMRAPAEAVRVAAADTYALVKKTAPNAKILVVGPIWVNENVPDNIASLRDAVRTAAIDAGATFVDPLAEGWFYGENAALISEDKVHPTDAGHAYLAKLIEPHIRAVLP